MTDNAFLIALGAFITSSGFAGLAAVGAAVIAYLGINKRLDGDREMLARRIKADGDLAAARARIDAETAAAGDERERWWNALMWVWEHHGELSDAAVLALIDQLEVSSTTPQQSAMLEAVMDAILTNGGGANGPQTP